MVVIAAGALAVNINIGGMNANERIFTIEWNAAAGTASVTEGGVVLMSAAIAPWSVPVGDVTPLYVGSVPGFGAIRADVALLQMVNA